MPENSSNVKPKGLLIPKPILGAFSHMSQEEVGILVQAMIWTFWDDGDDSPYDGPTDLSNAAWPVWHIWKAMVEEEEEPDAR